MKTKLSGIRCRQKQRQEKGDETIVEHKDCSEVNIRPFRLGRTEFTSQLISGIVQASLLDGLPLSTFPRYRPAEAKGNNTLQSPFLLVIAGSRANLASIPACALFGFPSVGDYVGDKSEVTP